AEAAGERVEAFHRYADHQPARLAPGAVARSAEAGAVWRATVGEHRGKLLVGAAVLDVRALDRARVPRAEQPRGRAVRVRGFDVGGDFAQLQRVPAAVELPLVIGSQVGLDQVGDAGRGEGRAGHEIGRAHV